MRQIQQNTNHFINVTLITFYKNSIKTPTQVFFLLMSYLKSRKKF
jgi:hypothetical protein